MSSKVQLSYYTNRPGMIKIKNSLLCIFNETFLCHLQITNNNNNNKNNESKQNKTKQKKLLDKQNNTRNFQIQSHLDQKEV